MAFKNIKVLAAPAEFYFTSGNYHVSYNLLTRIKAQFYGFTSKVDSQAKSDLHDASIQKA